MSKTEVLKRKLTAVETANLVEALKFLHYRKRSDHKRMGAPETVEQLEECRQRLADLDAIEALQVSIEGNNLFVEYVPKETDDKSDNKNDNDSQDRKMF